MKKLILILVTLIISSVAFAEEGINTHKDCCKAEMPKCHRMGGQEGAEKHLKGFYIETGLKGTEIKGKRGVFGEGEIGYKFTPKLSIGITGNKLLTEIEDKNKGLYTDICYSGLKGRYELAKSGKLHFGVGLLAGGGTINYTEDILEKKSHSEKKNGDHFWIVEPGIWGEADISNVVKINGGISYRVAGNINDEEFDNDELNRLSINAGIKAGIF